MEATTLHIKNMVCPRCVETVQMVFDGFGLHPQRVELGKVVLDKPLDELQRARLAAELRGRGFELLLERNLQLVEQIKTTLIKYLGELENRDDDLLIKLSAYLGSHLNSSYGQLSKTFSRETGTTIEKYWVSLKIERVKELISYGELTLSEIAWQLDYSSVQYLSNQFKKHTGLTPSGFKTNATGARKPLDAI